MKNKYSLSFVIGLLLVLMFNVISPLTLTTFNNTLGLENLTFFNSSDFTRYLDIPKYYIVNSSSLSLGGFDYPNITSLCYQESTNIYSQSSRDGLCFLNYSGITTVVDATNAYNCYGVENFYDGNWGTRGYCFDSPNAMYFFDYAKPIGNLQSALLQIKYTCRELGTEFEVLRLENFTLPNECLTQNNQYVNISFVTNAGGGTAGAGPNCWNGTSWHTLNTSCDRSAGYASLTGEGFFEEAIWWNISNYPVNVSLQIGNNNSGFNYINEYYPIDFTNRNMTFKMSVDGTWICPRCLKNDGSWDYLSNSNCLFYPGNFTNLTLVSECARDDGILALEFFMGNQNSVTRFYEVANYGLENATLNNYFCKNSTTTNITNCAYAFDGNAETFAGTEGAIGAQARLYLNYTYNKNTTKILNINQNVPDFTNLLNSYLDTCIYSNNLCSVPFKFSSITSGILQYFNILINFNHLNIILNSPEDGTTKPASVNFNCSGYSSDANLVNVTLFIYNSTGNQVYNETQSASGTSYTHVFPIDFVLPDTYKWTCLFSSENSSLIANNYSVTVQTSTIVVTLNSPTNNQIFIGNSVTFNYTPEIDGDNVSMCRLYTNTNGSWSIKDTDTLITKATINQFNLSGISDGVYKWNVQCNTTNSQLYSMSWQGNQTFYIDNSYPLLEILAPVGTLNTRTFSVSINASDLTLDSCYFNITRGASLEVATTKITDCSSITSSVSSDADYILHVCINDSQNRFNCSDQSFTVTTTTIGSTGGGGGGAVTVTGAGANWTVATDGRTSTYEIKMTSGSTRNKALIFNNGANSIRKIKLTCVGNIINGTDICGYVTFEQTEFDLPVLRNIDTEIYFNLDVPTNLDKGRYTGNIYATDDLGNKGVITLNVDIGNFGILTNVLVKAGTSVDISGVKVPYIILGFLFAIIFWGLSYLFLRKIPYGAGIAIFIGILAFFFSIAIL